MFVSTYNKRFLHIIALLLGWQPRWFVLEVGVLAYYKSQEEVGLGSRGSVKMTCCEISGKLEIPCCKLHLPLRLRKFEKLAK